MNFRSNLTAHTACMCEWSPALAVILTRSLPVRKQQLDTSLFRWSLDCGDVWHKNMCNKSLFCFYLLSALKVFVQLHGTFIIIIIKLGCESERKVDLGQQTESVVGARRKLLLYIKTIVTVYRKYRNTGTRLIIHIRYIFIYKLLLFYGTVHHHNATVKITQPLGSSLLSNIGYDQTQLCQKPRCTKMYTWTTVILIQ